jgi:hypothetical protein
MLASICFNKPRAQFRARVKSSLARANFVTIAKAEVVDDIE